MLGGPQSAGLMTWRRVLVAPYLGVHSGPGPPGTLWWISPLPPAGYGSKKFKGEVTLFDGRDEVGGAG